MQIPRPVAGIDRLDAKLESFLPDWDRTVKLEQIREYAMSLPEVTEEPHFDLSSFRVRGKILATVTADGRYLHIFVDEEDRERALALEPENFEKLWWGSRVVGLRTHIQQASPELVFELLRMSWRRKAPKKLIRNFDQNHPSA